MNLGYRLLLTIVFAFCGLVTTASAQNILFSFSFNETPLESAISLFAVQAGVDIVYASNLVEEESSNCVYLGSDAILAAQCLLKGSGLTLETVSSDQLVLVSGDIMQSSEWASVLERSTTGSLRGRVIDSRTRAPLSGAHITVLGEMRGDIADRRGIFRIDELPTGIHTLNVTYVGYHDRRIAASTHDEHLIVLEERGVTGQEIIVEETKGEELLEETVVPGAEPLLNRSGARSPSYLGEDDLAQTLLWMNGVHQTGELAGPFSVRGNEPDKNLYLIDGAPLYHPWNAMGIFSTLQTEMLASARLYRGSFPSEFGGRLSAVLDGELKDGNREDHEVRIAASPLTARFMVQGPISNKFSVMLSGRRSYTHGLLGSGSTIQHSRYRDFSGKIAFRPSSKQKISFTTYYGGDELPGSIASRTADYNEDALPAQEDLSSLGWNRYAINLDESLSNPYSWSNGLASLQHAYVGPGYLLTSTAYYTGYNARDAAYVGLESSGAADDGKFSSMDIMDIGLRFDADIAGGSDHSFKTGLHLAQHNYSYDPESNFFDDLGKDYLEANGLYLKGLEASAYAQDTWEVSSRFQVQPGLRASAFSKGGYIHLLPRLNVQWLAQPGALAFKAGYSRQVQYVQQVREQPNEFSESRWISAAADGIEPATGYQLAFTAELTPIRSLKLSAELFVRRFENVLVPKKDFEDVPDWEIGPAALGTSDIGVQKVEGIEFLLEHSRGPWKAWLAYAGGLSEVKTNGDEFFYEGRFDVPRTVRGALNWRNARWSLSLLGEARNGFPVASTATRLRRELPQELDDVTENQFGRNLGRLPDYVRIDATAGYRFNLSALQVRTDLQIFNILDRKNVVGKVFDLSSDSSPPLNRLGLPFTPLLKVEVAW